MTTYEDCTYTKHTLVKFGAAFRVDELTLTDPGVVTATVIAPDGTVTPYTTADSELTSPVTLPQNIADELNIGTGENTAGTGLALLAVILDTEGDYKIRIRGTGNGADVAKEVLAIVDKTPFD